MRQCSIAGCGLPYNAKGFCRKHYLRSLRHGDPLALKKAPNGSGSERAGYRFLEIGGKQRREHVLIAERILGRSLRAREGVHHVDGDGTNNSHSNLVIFPTQAYHFLMHKRAEALDACGHADWMRCRICGEWDSQANLKAGRNKTHAPYGYEYAYHRACNAKKSRNYHRARNGTRTALG